MGSIAGAAVWVIAAIFGGGVMGVWWGANDLLVYRRACRSIRHRAGGDRWC